MKFTINGTEYTIVSCSAIAISANDTERQNALLVSCCMNGEKSEYVVFGHAMPETDDDFMLMCDDPWAWSSNQEDLKTVKLGGKQ